MRKRLSNNSRRRMMWFAVLSLDKLLSSDKVKGIEKSFQDKYVETQTRNTTIISGRDNFDKREVAEKHKALKMFSVLDSSEDNK